MRDGRLLGLLSWVERERAGGCWSGAGAGGLFGLAVVEGKKKKKKKKQKKKGGREKAGKGERGTRQGRFLGLKGTTTTSISISTSTASHHNNDIIYLLRTACALFLRCNIY